MRGVVSSVRPFGVFVRPAGKARDGLVHCTQVSDELTFAREDSDDAKVMAMEYFFPRGAEVWVKVLDVRVEGGTGGYADPNDRSGRAGAGAGAEGGRALRGGGRPPSAPKVSLSMKLVDQETGEDLDPGHAACHGGDRGFHLDFGDRGGDPNPPALHSIARAVVRAVKPYGVFARPEGRARDVLVPSHQVSENLRFDKEDDDAARVAGVEGVVTRGDAVFVKIVEIKDDPRDAAGPPRVTASMKLCDQGSGADLDPDGARYRPAGDRGAEGDAGARDRRVGAGAGDRVRASGVIDWGHHAGDVKQMRLLGDGEPPDGGARYDLLEDDPEADREMRGARFDGRGPDGRVPPPPPPGGPPRGGGGTFEVPPPGRARGRLASSEQRRGGLGDPRQAQAREEGAQGGEEGAEKGAEEGEEIVQAVAKRSASEKKRTELERFERFELGEFGRREAEPRRETRAETRRVVVSSFGAVVARSLRDDSYYGERRSLDHLHRLPSCRGKGERALFFKRFSRFVRVTDSF